MTTFINVSDDLLAGLGRAWREAAEHAWVAYDVAFCLAVEAKVAYEHDRRYSGDHINTLAVRAFGVYLLLRQQADQARQLWLDALWSRS